MRRLRAFVAGIGMVFAAACTSPAMTRDDGVARIGTASGSVVRDIVYATIDGRALRLDVYAPPVPGSPRMPAPVLVHVHGGGWSRGARPDGDAPFRAARAMGFAVIAIEYRLADEAQAPAAVQDVRCALDWIRIHANRLGIDPGRIVLQGVSAGGHLALLAAMAPGDAGFDADGCHAPPPVAAVLDFYGIADVTTWHSPSGAVERWIGPRADAAEVAARLSPMRYVRAGAPPTFIVHGDADPTVPYAQSQRLHDALRQAGVPVALFRIAGGRHGDFSAQQTADAWAAARAFLVAQGVLPRVTSNRMHAPDR